MRELFQRNPVGRFTGLADIYARYRPSYAVEVIDYLMEILGLDATTLLVDIGSGTGISSRLFADRGVPVLGIEPNEEMRIQAEQHPTERGRSPEFRHGKAEATGLADKCATAILSAQAFHWFDAPTALVEFHRILKPGGRVALMWNERDPRDPFTAAYGALIRTLPDAAAFELPRYRANQALLDSSHFEDARVATFTNQQFLDAEGLVGRAFSVSYAPREPAEIAAFQAELHRLFSRFQNQGTVCLHYVTTVTTAQRRDESTN